MATIRNRELTIDQLEVLKLSADGLLVQAIAAQLRKSVAAVKTQRSKVMIKLGADTMPQAVAMALRRRIID